MNEPKKASVSIMIFTILSLIWCIAVILAIFLGSIELIYWVFQGDFFHLIPTIEPTIGKAF